MDFPTDVTNQVFQLAVRFVNQTDRHIFLTGKAGTGKTTFLKYIRDHSTKKMAIVAPTGVAAINAGGVTMHSFFQLPLGAFIPTLHNGWSSNNNFNTPHTLIANLRIATDKRRLLQELELLVIDEVSMLRADILDEIDCILRHFRSKPFVPFGGVQILYIGDLFQLPPVVKREEWEVLREHYQSSFFFDAQIVKQAPPLYLELRKIYRQHEQDFIDLLNNIRYNQVSDSDLERLHQHYKPGYDSPEEENYITLTTHNAKADTINQNKLDRLPGRLYEFKAEIKGEFSDRAYPADMVLQLREGAQIMLIKNDKGESRRYFNGKIAIIASLDKDKIHIRFPGETNEMELAQEVWRNIRYRYNQEKDIIEEEELGTFRQYPIRLAWAITIHKSQGLTFEKAIVDAGFSFAPGQVYVALSRLTSLTGLILYSRIQPSCINTDERVLEFTRSEKKAHQLEEELEQERDLFITRSLLQTFDWLQLLEVVREHFEHYKKKNIPDKGKCIQWGDELLAKLSEQQEVAERSTRQLTLMLDSVLQDGYQHFHQQVSTASEYCLKAVNEAMISILGHINEVKNNKKAGRYVRSLDALYTLFDKRRRLLKASMQVVEGLVKGVNASDLLELVESQKKVEFVSIEITVTARQEVQAKPQKGDSHRVSLEMFKQGKDIAGISELRGLAESTISGHLASFITTGELSIQELVAEDKISAISKTIEELELQNYPVSISAVKEKLGEDFSYGEIRAVSNYRECMQAKKEI